MSKPYKALIEELYACDEETLERRYVEEHAHVTTEEDGVPIAHLGALFRDLHSPVGSVRAAFLLDAVVTENRRRKGVFTELFRRFASENSECAVLYGFPRPYELIHLTDRQGFSLVGEVRVFAKVLRPDDILSGQSWMRSIVSTVIRLTRSRDKMRDISAFTTTVQASSFDVEAANALWCRVEGDYPLMSERSSDFLRLALSKHSGFRMITAEKDGHLEGYAIVRRIDRGAMHYYMIYDLIWASPEALDAVYHCVLEDANREKISMIGVWESQKLGAFLREKRFVYAKSAIAFVARSDREDISVSKLSDWYLQPIEGEVY